MTKHYECHQRGKIKEARKTILDVRVRDSSSER
jgi:hypothetical protein